MKAYGLFFADIPQIEVPYDWHELEHFDILENSFGQRLVYHKINIYEGFYKFINDDQSRFISKDQMRSAWKKV